MCADISRPKTRERSSQEIEPVIAGKYRVAGEIGRGSFAIVYRANHHNLDTLTYAIKVLKRASSDNPEVVRRFRREAEALASLRSPFVVQVVDYGETASGLPFLVMPLLDGMSCDRIIERDGYMRPSDVARAAGDVLRALIEAHDRGMVHRDLKPSNIFLRAVPGQTHVQAKVLDFGIVKIVDTGSSINDTAEGIFLGTPAYAAPELLRGRPDSRSDLYALGHTMAALLDGTAPYGKEPTNALVIARHLGAGAVPVGPRTEASGLELVIRRACEKSADLRYSDASEMLEALEATQIHELDDIPLETRAEDGTSDIEHRSSGHHVVKSADGSTDAHGDTDELSLGAGGRRTLEVNLAATPPFRHSESTPIGSIAEERTPDFSPAVRRDSAALASVTRASAERVAVGRDPSTSEPSAEAESGRLRRWIVPFLVGSLIALSLVLALALQQSAPNAVDAGAEHTVLPVAGSSDHAEQTLGSLRSTSEAGSVVAIAADGRAQSAASQSESAQSDATLGFHAFRVAVDFGRGTVRRATSVGPDNVVDLASDRDDRDDIRVYLGDHFLGTLPLRGAFVPSTRPLTLTFRGDSLNEARQMIFEDSGPLVDRLVLGETRAERRDRRRREREERERRDLEAPNTEIPSTVDDDSTLESTGAESEELLPRHNDLRNPFE